MTIFCDLAFANVIHNISESGSFGIPCWFSGLQVRRFQHGQRANTTTCDSALIGSNLAAHMRHQRDDIFRFDSGTRDDEISGFWCNRFPTFVFDIAQLFQQGQAKTDDVRFTVDRFQFGRPNAPPTWQFFTIWKLHATFGIINILVQLVSHICFRHCRIVNFNTDKRNNDDVRVTNDRVQFGRPNALPNLLYFTILEFAHGLLNYYGFGQVGCHFWFPNLQHRQCQHGPIAKTTTCDSPMFASNLVFQMRRQIYNRLRFVICIWYNEMLRCWSRWFPILVLAFAHFPISARTNNKNDDVRFNIDRFQFGRPGAPPKGPYFTICNFHTT